MDMLVPECLRTIDEWDTDSMARVMIVTADVNYKNDKLINTFEQRILKFFKVVEGLDGYELSEARNKIRQEGLNITVVTRVFLAYASLRIKTQKIFDLGSRIISFFALHEQLRVKHVATIYEAWSTVGYINLTLTDKLNEQIRVNSAMESSWKPWSISRTFRGLAMLKFFDQAVFDYMAEKMANLLTKGTDFFQEDLQAIMQGVSYTQHKNTKMIIAVKNQFEHQLIVITRPAIIIDIMYGFQVSGFLDKESFLQYVTRLCELRNQGREVTDPILIEKLSSCFLVQGGYELDGINSGMFDYLANCHEETVRWRKKNTVKVNPQQQQKIQECLMKLDVEFDTVVWLSDVGYYVGALIRQHSLIVEVENEFYYSIRNPYRLLGQGMIRRMEMAASGYNMLVIPFHAAENIKFQKLLNQVQRQLDELGVDYTKPERILQSKDDIEQQFVEQRKNNNSSHSQGSQGQKIQKKQQFKQRVLQK
eukprot:TRINITY_DN5376_c1_g3_i1.p1 TRINITY_DN5376_c1_g3~~TRINITY_DN5376_c1_g3_i1.p1  ORF type:complete len:478 (-),score=65.96 TRINITY_DN5376_c1_g3_i1:86-1519(-)